MFTDLFISWHPAIKDKLLCNFMSLKVWVRCTLTPHNWQDYFCEDLKFLPVDAIACWANKGSATFLSRDQISTMERDEWNTRKRRVLPCQAVGKVTLLGAH